jgi:hypothetical protein
MKTIVTTVLTIFYLGFSAQVGYNVDIWNAQVGIEEIMIYNPEDESMIAEVSIEFDDVKFEKKITVDAQDWKTVTYESLGLTYDKMPTSSGAVKALVMVAAGGQGVLGDYYYISSRNRMQPYEVNIEEISERINYYGTIIDDCIFWIDFNGYNYVIRSHNEKNGIYLSHWISDIEGGTERLGYYKGFKDCEGEKLVQRHSIGWALEDKDEDAYMEFYSLVVDGCVTDWKLPTPATLVVFTYEAGLSLTGTTYSLEEDATDLGGHYKANEKLKKHPKLLEQAEDAWEVYIME